MEIARILKVGWAVSKVAKQPAAIVFKHRTHDGLLGVEPAIERVRQMFARCLLDNRS